MDTDVKAKKVTATGSVYGDRTRVRAIAFKPSAAGSIVLKDGGASGTTLIDIDVDTASTTYMVFPGNGVLFSTNVYATLTTVASLTVFYG